MKAFSLITINLFIFLFCNDLISQPNKADYFLTYGATALVLGSQLLQDELAPAEPRWKEPNAFDLYFRNKLKWPDSDIDYAHKLSDVLLWGMLIPSVLWTPAIGGHKYNEHLLLNLQVMAATGLLVGITKYLTARERPYAYFGIKTNADKSADNISFFSGHSAFTFAAATMVSMTLQNKYGHYSGWIWSGTLTCASATAILRIAADRHYMSDILVGTFIGMLTAYIITKNQSGTYFLKRNLQPNVLYLSVSL